MENLGSFCLIYGELNEKSDNSKEEFSNVYFCFIKFFITMRQQFTIYNEATNKMNNFKKSMVINYQKCKILKTNA